MSKMVLNKQLWTGITRLKLLTKPNARVKFILDETPFDEDGNEEEVDAAASKDIIITGRILPNSEIYREGAYKIEMKLLPTYPNDPPEVRFLTPIYHPNVGKDGKFCHELLTRFGHWTWGTSLVDVVRVVVQRIDKPALDSFITPEIGIEYMQCKSEFDRKALEYVKKYALPRH